MKRQILIASLLLAACARTYSAESMRQLDIAGAYATRVSLMSSKCGVVRVEDEEIGVEHVPGSSTVRLTYHGVAFDGTIRPDGKFRTNDVNAYRDSNDWTAVAWIEGRFSGSGFEASVRVRRSRGSCEYLVRWKGSRR